MSKNVNVNYTNLQQAGLQVDKTTNPTNGMQMKIAGINKSDQVDVTLNLSSEGKLIAENQGYLKQAGETHVREVWENQQEMKTIIRTNSTGNYSITETLRMDEPETYEKWKELASDLGTLLGKYLDGDESVKDELEKVTSKEVEVLMEWYERRCMATGTFKNPVNREFGSIIALEGYLSNCEHDTSINTYGGKELDYRESMWRFNSKFNVLLSKEALNIVKGLADFNNKSDKEKKQIASFVNRMEKSVEELRNIEKRYEGDLKYLRFGVKFDENGELTYHANYRDCEDEEGIMASSAEELLELLNSKK